MVTPHPQASPPKAPAHSHLRLIPTRVALPTYRLPYLSSVSPTRGGLTGHSSCLSAHSCLGTTSSRCPKVGSAHGLGGGGGTQGGGEEGQRPRFESQPWGLLSVPVNLPWCLLKVAARVRRPGVQSRSSPHPLEPPLPICQRGVLGEMEGAEGLSNPAGILH